MTFLTVQVTEDDLLTVEQYILETYKVYERGLEVCYKASGYDKYNACQCMKSDSTEESFDESFVTLCYAIQPRSKHLEAAQLANNRDGKRIERRYFQIVTNYDGMNNASEDPLVPLQHQPPHIDLSEVHHPTAVNTITVSPLQGEDQGLMIFPHAAVACALYQENIAGNLDLFDHYTKKVIYPNLLVTMTDITWQKVKALAREHLLDKFLDNIEGYPVGEQVPLVCSVLPGVEQKVYGIMPHAGIPWNKPKTAYRAHVDNSTRYSIRDMPSEYESSQGEGGATRQDQLKLRAAQAGVPTYTEVQADVKFDQGYGHQLPIYYNDKWWAICRRFPYELRPGPTVCYHLRNILLKLIKAVNSQNS